MRTTNRRNTLGTALVVLAVLLFTLPAVFPVQPMLVHDTLSNTVGSPDEYSQGDQRTLAYENLSERGQELYRETLRNDGEYHVPLGEGAADFSYPTQTELNRAYRNVDQTTTGRFVIVRPANESNLPPADEPDYDRRLGEDASEAEQRRAEMMRRYDAMVTMQSEPPLGATPQLMRLASVLLAVLSLGVGGYLLSSK